MTAPVTELTDRARAVFRVVVESYLGSGVPSRDIPRFLELYRRGKLPVDRLLTHRIALEDINEGFDRLHDGTAIRQIVDFL